MFDLCIDLPQLRTYRKVLVVAGGRSVIKYYDEICERMCTEPDTALFDTNQHFIYPEANFERLMRSQQVKITFALDFDLDMSRNTHSRADAIQELTASTEKWLTLPESYFAWNNAGPRRNPNEVFKTKVDESKLISFRGVSWDHFVRTPGSLREGLTIAPAICAVPEHCRMEIYGADLIITEGSRHAMEGVNPRYGKEQDAQTKIKVTHGAREKISPIVNYFAEEMGRRVSVHV